MTRSLLWLKTDCRALLFHSFGLLMLAGCLGLTSTTARAEVDFDALKGRVVYLDFWASWCGPCRESFPWMQAMHQRYESKGLTIVAVNLDQQPELAQQFLKQYAVDFRIESDPNAELADYFDIQTMPTSFLIDREGRARTTHSGFHADKRGEYEMEIRRLLEQKP